MVCGLTICPSLTVVTPIPDFIPRQFAVNVLHSHGEVITLNPHVVEHTPIKAPADTPVDECDSNWYEIIERKKIIAGRGQPGSGMITFNGISRDVSSKGCFHNMPWGLQTHIKGPMSVDLRIRYSVDGNQPGIEPARRLELGLESLGAPTDGLYLRQDIEVTCNIAMLKYIKAPLKTEGGILVVRMIKKAEQAGVAVLERMLEDSKLSMSDSKGGPSMPAELPDAGFSAFPPIELAAEPTSNLPHGVASKPYTWPTNGQRIEKANPGQFNSPPPLSKERHVFHELPGDLNQQPRPA
ncbi:hypothetical protein B0J13DRAFT_531340 [Dactylonectria estremocensis]|uniref:DUF7053 domain-containing protein n=1 Tax=Dactylonectria estremocensis TaxID=1079267 RepID=A0A9P9DQI8_9HYPO|nr:hypothetical protein B0J13DRAFT_531340 [Dactylonectria estremocensis]